jgi:hypothetical protein
MTNTIEFLKDSDGRLSMSRLLSFMGFFVLAFICLYLTFTGSITEGILGIFAGSFSAQYVFGKFADAKVEAEQAKIESEYDIANRMDY